MQTDADTGTRRRVRMWVMALAAVAVAAVTAGVLYATLGDDTADADSGAGDVPTLPPQSGLDAALTDRVVEILESASMDEHADHGHHVDDEAHGLICEAYSFGYQPADAEAVDQVEEVYAQHFCAAYGPGEEWPRAINASGPIAVDLTTEPATVTLPDALVGEPDLETHADRVRALIPEKYHEEALAHDAYGDPALGERLRHRFAQRSG